MSHYTAARMPYDLGFRDTIYQWMSNQRLKLLFNRMTDNRD